jgi:excinuclease ABC subunit C
MYRKNIRDLIRVLEGKSQIVVKELQREMETLSSQERFEEAQELKRRITALQIITEPAIRPFEYDLNPNLRSDIREKEVTELHSALIERGLVLSLLERIECYDISNIQGTNSTGSLVVLTNGEIDKSQYRRFKIHLDGKPNDFAMMDEMLTRRLKHTEWKKPDLIIVDGGKGQLSSALSAMEKTGVFFPVVGLAKREETLIIPIHQQFFQQSNQKDTATINNEKRKLYGSNEENFTELSLPKNSPSLHLIQRIRNEAHRFAITYHRKLRSKKMTEELFT